MWQTSRHRRLSGGQPGGQTGQAPGPTAPSSPGHTQLHRLPCWMKPAAAGLARPVTAAVVVLYAQLSATPEKERKGQSLSRVRLSAAPWTVARQAPLSMGFSRQEDWSGLPCPPPGGPPDPGMETGPPALQADALPLSQQCISYLRRRGRRNKKAVSFRKQETPVLLPHTPPF